MFMKVTLVDIDTHDRKVCGYVYVKDQLNKYIQLDLHSCGTTMIDDDFDISSIAQCVHWHQQ